MTARITMFVLVAAVVLFVLPSGASPQQVTAPLNWGSTDMIVMTLLPQPLARRPRRHESRLHRASEATKRG